MHLDYKKHLASSRKKKPTTHKHYLRAIEQACESEKGNRPGCEIGAFLTKTLMPDAAQMPHPPRYRKSRLRHRCQAQMRCAGTKRETRHPWNRSYQNIHAPRQPSFRSDHTPSTGHSQWKSRSSSHGAQKQGLPACDSVPTHSCRVFDALELVTTRSQCNSQGLNCCNLLRPEKPELSEKKQNERLQKNC